MADLVTSGEVVALVPSLAGHGALALLISAASNAIEKRCRRIFASGTVTETHSGNSLSRVWLNRPPITSITSVAVDGTALDNTDGYGWGYNADTGELFRGNGRGDMRFASVFPGGSGNVSVVYVGGYATIPPDIKVACITLVKHLADGAKATGLLKSESIGDYSYTMADAMLVSMPAQTLALLAPYIMDPIT
jgi:hypothetical protein